MAKHVGAQKMLGKAAKAGAKSRAPVKRTPGKPNVKKSSAGKHPAKQARSPALPPVRLIDGEAAIDEALAALLALDPEVIAHLHALGGRPPLRLRAPGFEGLVWIIISQQVSVASADAIGARVKAGVVPLEASRLLELDDAALRACGLSGPKMRTLRALSAAIVQGGLALQALGSLLPDEAHAQLTAVKGIGPWTADIFLLFCLGHPDAWPAGDLALQEAARLALKLDVRPDAAGLEAIGERWRPWRGVAARLLWSYYRVAKSREGIALA